MKFCIPHCGQTLVLIEDAVVSIQVSYPKGNSAVAIAGGTVARCQDNYQHFEYISGPNFGEVLDYKDQISILLPKGTKLKISKLYIRNGGWYDDSVSFRIISCPIKNFVKNVISVPLTDVNNMHVDLHKMDN